MKTCKCNNYIQDKPYTEKQCRICWENANAPKRMPLKLFNRCKHWTGEKTGTKVDIYGNPGAGGDCACRTQYACNKHKNVIIASNIPGNVSCVCNDYEDKLTPTPKDFTYKDAVVSIGHYNMPCTVEYHVKSLRKNCGNVPICITDDFTEMAFNTTKPEKRIVPKEIALESKQRLLGFCAENNVPLFTSGVNRLGHVGGDLAAFYNGLTYAKSVGAKYMIKISQRFFIDRNSWVQKMVHRMDQENADVMTNEHVCKLGILTFPIRSEFMILRVSKFGTDTVMQDLYPRKLQGMAGEIYITAIVQKTHAKLISCPMFTNHRGRKHPGLIWYEEPNAEANYREAYKKYDIEMSNGFHLHYAPESVNWIG
jgi:hypothetical protein